MTRDGLNVLWVFTFALCVMMWPELGRFMAACAVIIGAAVAVWILVCQVIYWVRDRSFRVETLGWSGWLTALCVAVSALNLYLCDRGTLLLKGVSAFVGLYVVLYVFLDYRRQFL